MMPIASCADSRQALVASNILITSVAKSKLCKHVMGVEVRSIIEKHVIQEFVKVLMICVCLVVIMIALIFSGCLTV